jgi:hypothetical protein
MPTDATRERMPLSYTAGHCSLLYGCRLQHNDSERGRAAAAEGTSFQAHKAGEGVPTRTLHEWATIQIPSSDEDEDGNLEFGERRFWFKSSGKKDRSVPIVANCRPASDDLSLEDGAALAKRLVGRIDGRLESDRGRAPVYFVDPDRTTDSNAFVLLRATDGDARRSGTDPDAAGGDNRKGEFSSGAAPPPRAPARPRGLEEWTAVDPEEQTSPSLLVPEENAGARLSVHVGSPGALAELAGLLLAERPRRSRAAARRASTRADAEIPAFGFGPGETAAIVVEFGGAAPTAGDSSDGRRVRRTREEIVRGVSVEAAREAREDAEIFFVPSESAGPASPWRSGRSVRRSLGELRRLAESLGP